MANLPPHGMAEMGQKTSPIVAKKAVIVWLCMLFAYAWWLVIIVYFSLFDPQLPLALRLQAIPLVFVSFTLAALFQQALKTQRYLLALLLFSGLLVAGALA